MIYGQQITRGAYLSKVKGIVEVVPVTFPRQYRQVLRKIGHKIEFLVNSSREVYLALLGPPTEIQNLQLLRGSKIIPVVHFENLVPNTGIDVSPALKNIKSRYPCGTSVDMKLRQEWYTKMRLLRNHASWIQHKRLGHFLKTVKQLLVLSK